MQNGLYECVRTLLLILARCRVVVVQQGPVADKPSTGKLVAVQAITCGDECSFSDMGVLLVELATDPAHAFRNQVVTHTY